MNIGVNGMLHDCHVCVDLVKRFGTCEYMHDANPSRCTCWMTVQRKKFNVQSPLQTASTDRTRYRYWMHWMRTEGVRLGLFVGEQPAPNLSKTGDEKSAENAGK